MSHPILYATDFSEGSDAALHYASSLARQANTELYIVHVSEALPTSDNPNPRCHSPPAIIAAETSAQEQIEQVQPTHAEVRFVRRILHGDPAEEIIRFAAENEVDSIVMGTHGRTGLTHALMGSVAEKVVRMAPCPVLVTRGTMEISAQ